LKSRTEEELDMLLRKNHELNDAVNTVKKLSWSKIHRMRAEGRLRDWRDEQAMLDDAREDERIKIAHNLRTINMSDEQICRITGLTQKELKKMSII
jgi:hypothetical protein